ncbi:TPA_asm: RNA-directed RNA polymerase [ssRNA phage Gephyllon.3_18]|uniref:RNA-directed RNA polymerase n=2 Tax=Leviviricetes TaxID=2842243 RepID=A0A8S5L3L0_9VIRU|nr:RNA-directed RNA polymerase [ssRNA phage Gephyllon.3_18]QDH86574.1 MAG: RNA-dependent RNA polymerase [Leviviridae sp.]DAD52091.1 TPA_asm: RNA-directed RNA polymerase [ssRNA phage Gephyllon.3_18]
MKSNASDLLELAEVVYFDASAMCVADVFDYRDLNTIRSRVETEGVSFLTITLPTFARDFEQALAHGCIDSTAFRSFRKVGAIPAFMQGMLSLLFDPQTGDLLDEPPRPADTTAGLGYAGYFASIVRCVRQVCLTFKKIEVPCSQERVARAYAAYTEVERSFNEFNLDPQDWFDFVNTSYELWSNLAPLDFNPMELDPSHGPGSTAERLVGNDKYTWKRWHDRLENFFPLVGHGYPSGAHPDDREIQDVSIVSVDDEEPVRVVDVPKTLKAPRIIALEPACMQYAQHALQAYLQNRLENEYWLSRGHINFADQSINQRLAIDGSTNGRYATFDLSDASDRVPLSLVKIMFRSNPNLLGSILACRSYRAKLPDGHLVHLQKFASMGSALCFPVEAMYFYTICVIALLKDRKLSCTPGNIFKVITDVYVYGDDLVVPSANATAVAEALQKYNCKVNTNKTFFRGSFRESCGVDAFRGEEVTPFYLTQLRPRNRRDVKSLISWVSAGQNAYKRGFWKTAAHLWRRVEQHLGPLPYGGQDFSGLCRISFLGPESIGRFTDRWNYQTQRREVKAWVPIGVTVQSDIDGFAALAKSFHKMRRSKWAYREKKDVLSSHVLRNATALRRSWVPLH